MLQQTQVATVLPYYDRFIGRFPDVEVLAKSSEREVLELWAGLGYYNRAKNLLRAARLALARHGQFPRELASIMALPGIGRYTAGAICSIAFNLPEPIVDGNIRRILLRLTGKRQSPLESFFWRLMAALIPADEPSDFNQAMMELGALVCIPSEPRCNVCPVARQCRARACGIQSHIPAPRNKPVAEQVEIAVLILKQREKLLLARSRKSSIIPGEWGFPFRRLMSGETPERAAAALCREIIGRAVPLSGIPAIRHSITRYRITAYGFVLKREGRIPKLVEMDGLRWVPVARSVAALTSSLFRKTLLLSDTDGSVSKNKIVGRRTRS
jgi:A/G-specific adenine glycosylase